MPSKKMEQFFTKSTVNRTDSKIFKLKKILVVLVAIFLIGIIFIIVFAAAPCQFKSCHANATCINRPFNAKCKCNTGFQGNGIECDECGLAYPDPSITYAKLNYTNPNPYYPFSKFVPPFSYPSYVMIEFFWEGNLYSADKSHQYFYLSSYQCGGVLINRRTILTAASCVRTTVRFSPSGLNNDTLYFDVINKDTSYPDLNTIFFIHVKLLNYKSKVNYWPTETVYIDKIIIHDGYTPYLLDNNVALIKLKNSLPLDNYGQIACLPDSDDVRIEPLYLAYNNSAITVGWQYYFSSSSYILSEYRQNIVYNSDCNYLNTNATDNSQIICTEDFNGILAPLASVYCNGLLGGPLFVKKQVNNVSKLIVIGIAMNNTKCGLDIYANLFYFLDWINENADY